jgi:hypothetical protein
MCYRGLTGGEPWAAGDPDEILESLDGGELGAVI